MHSSRHQTSYKCNFLQEMFLTEAEEMLASCPSLSFTYFQTHTPACPHNKIKDLMGFSVFKVSDSPLIMILLVFSFCRQLAFRLLVLKIDLHIFSVLE